MSYEIPADKIISGMRTFDECVTPLEYVKTKLKRPVVLTTGA
jgi:hypothetical protein